MVAVGVLGFWALQPVDVLEIRTGPEGQLVKSVPVVPGDKITYSYVHSIQKRPVVEIMEVASNRHLVVREAVYDMVGVGLPSDVPDGTLFLDEATGKFHIVGMSRDIPVWRVRVAFTAEQTLELPGEKFTLDSLAAPLTLLEISVVQRPRFSVWRFPFGRE